MSDNVIWEIRKSIEYTVSEVANRGWADNPLEVDRFANLRKERRIREAQVAALYEQYFLPERHEFEWQVLSDIATAITTSSVTQFAAVAVAGGALGNAAYDLLKIMCSYAASQFEEKLGDKARERAKSFRQLSTDAEKLKSFFSKNQKARIEEIEQATGLPREKVYPLMKLAGLNHYRRYNPCYWELPQ
jgi:hypothetical protein